MAGSASGPTQQQRSLQEQKEEQTGTLERWAADEVTLAQKKKKMLSYNVLPFFS